MFFLDKNLISVRSSETKIPSLGVNVLCKEPKLGYAGHEEISKQLCNVANFF